MHAQVLQNIIVWLTSVSAMLKLPRAMEGEDDFEHELGVVLPLLGVDQPAVLDLDLAPLSGDAMRALGFLLFLLPATSYTLDKPSSL